MQFLGFFLIGPHEEVDFLTPNIDLTARFGVIIEQIYK